MRARDSLTPLAVRELLIRRRGQASWISLPTTPDRDGFSAFVDDERLARGVYDLRARAVDEAGNERTADKREDGTTARLALPLRSGPVSQLAVPSVFAPGTRAGSAGIASFSSSGRGAGSDTRFRCGGGYESRR